MTANLREVIDTLSDIGDDFDALINVKTGEILTYIANMGIEEDEEEWEDKFFDDDWISFPTKYDINAYQMMVDFIALVPDEIMQSDLASAIRGSGAFRRFKDYVGNHNLLEQWYAFEQQQWQQKAIAFLKENDIPYTE
ncbi:UPF0158 family protein [Weissella confusa]|uniref:UPF0158 family protein n=1 Tax=Weissella confusa TaxID=1583 RepID=UPI00223BCE19|nr:UPF0158 family protein [Weissella confusa]MCT0014103.1 hypothetical protein [Weissella confusa]